MKRFLFKYKKLVLGFFLVAVLALILAAPALAQDDDEEVTPVKFNPQVTIPGSIFKSGGSVLLENNTAPIAKYISAIYNYGVSIVGILASLMLMIGGIIWLTAAGSSSKIEQAKEFIFSSLTGMALLLVAVILLRTINPALVEFRNPTLTTIDKVDPCCNSLRGPTFEVTVTQTPERLIYNCAPPKELDGDDAEVEKCTGKSKCQISPESTETAPKYGCVDPDRYTCCEYESDIGDDEESLFSCMSVESAKGETCPTPAEKGMGMVTYSSNRQIEKYYCQTGVIVGLKVNGCKVDCNGKDKGELCNGLSDGGRCYGTDDLLTCRFGGARKSLGDICGNTDATTRCMPGGYSVWSGDLFEGHCDDSRCLDHDNTVTSGEECDADGETELACCYFAPDEGYLSSCSEKDIYKKWYPKETGTAN